MERVAAAATIDALGRVTGWSEGARILTGHRAEKVVGRPATDLLAEQVPAEAPAARRGTVALRRADGRRTEIALTACPVLGPDGGTTGYLLTAAPPFQADPTLAGQAFQQASMSMSVFDLRRRHLRSNDVACHALGVPEEALLGRFFPDTVEGSPHGECLLRRLRQVAETGRPVRSESFTGAPCVMPEQPADDVALLLARTRPLGADRVATWDVPPDPAAAAHFRQAAVERLGEGGLDEAAFVTELVVSELVTNAIRYGEPPVQLCLIRDRTLIREVSDGSSTSPHLRRAHAFDEGGRGLLLVAQLTQRRGSRQTVSGKTIRAEQPLPEGPSPAAGA
ncbi:PAS domain-containing protein [Streptomyces sp. NPDC086777]|uniref:PAS domain-containing protein n=1 Tax=Streptomyces sp. NPDC086777 TaxID=3154866 RepID=UPI00344DED48